VERGLKEQEESLIALCVRVLIHIYISSIGQKNFFYEY